jgi:hypothetical protein
LELINSRVLLIVLPANLDLDNLLALEVVTVAGTAAGTGAAGAGTIKTGAGPTGTGPAGTGTDTGALEDK